VSEESKPGGRKRTIDVREILNGIFYVLWTGCQWQALPKDPPPKSTVWLLSGRALVDDDGQALALGGKAQDRPDKILAIGAVDLSAVGPDARGNSPNPADLDARAPAVLSQIARRPIHMVHVLQPPGRAAAQDRLGAPP
jgi:hypothetical protein